MARSRQRIQVLAGSLRFVRGQRDFSQERLANAVGVTPGMIALIETGRRQPGRPLLDRMAAVLDVTPDVLAFIDDDTEESAA